MLHAHSMSPNTQDTIVCQDACLLACEMTTMLVAQGCTIQTSEEDSRKFYVNDHGKQMKLRAESE